MSKALLAWAVFVVIVLAFFRGVGALERNQKVTSHNHIGT